ncbi:hypothetical protein [Roseivirga sp.]|uniref:hypothetical protein n=1 Tax=Roseivirga sp. TaxID=1964215 RepID=UPI003B8E2D21
MRQLLALLLMIVSAQCFSQTEIYEKSVALEGRRISIDADMASTINVSTWNKKQVQVKVTYEVNEGDLNEAVEVVLDEQNSRLRLKVDVDEKLIRNAQVSDCERENATYWGSRNGRKVCAIISIEVFVPEKTELDIETVLADVMMEGAFEELDIKTVTGDIDVTWPEQQGTEIDLKTATGSIFTDFQFNRKMDKGLPAISSRKIATTYKGGEGYLKLESVTSDIYLRKG